MVHSIDDQVHPKWTLPDQLTQVSRATMHAQVLDDVRRVLSQSLELDATLQAVSGIIVPMLSDICALYTYERDNTFRLVTLNHADPARVAMFEAFHGFIVSSRLPHSLLQRIAAFETPRIVAATFAAPIDDDFDDAALTLMRAVGFTSYALVPLRSRERLEGMISLAMLSHDRLFGAADIVPLIGLGQALAQALERVRLYSTMREEVSARRQAEAELRAFYNSVPFRLGIVERRDDELYMAVANEALAQLLEMTAGQLVDRSLRELVLSLNVPVEEYEDWRLRFDETWRTRKSAQYQFSLRGRHLTLSVAPLDDVMATRPRCCFILEDVTTERQIAAALAESEQRFRAVLRDSPIAVFTHTRDLRYSWIYNPPSSMAPEGFLGRTDADLFLPEDAAALMAFKRNVLHTSTAGRLEIGLTVATEKRVYNLRAEPIIEADGSVSGLLCVSIDITESKRSQANLQASEARYRMLVANLPDTAVALLNPDLSLALFEGSLQAVLGIDATVHIGQSFAQLIEESEHPAVHALIQSATAGVGGETTFRSKGRTLHLEALPIDRLASHDREVMLVLRDLTERVQAEAERLKLERRLLETQRSESIGVLASGVAHDFNNILTSILGHAELVRGDASLDAEARRSVDAVMTGARRAADLTRQILAYTGKAMVQMQPLAINGLVLEMVELLRASIAKNCDLVSQLAGDLPLVEGDASQIRQVIMNLLINASEAIGNASGHIIITSSFDDLTRALLDTLILGGEREPGRYVRLTVGDTGQGMDAATQARMFDPYFTTKFTGRGLGLAAVHGIVRGHRGAIRVTSIPGQGTSFSVWLPVVATPKQEPPAPPPPRARGRGYVLVIDDEPGICDITARLLTREGFTVSTSNDPERGLAMAREAIGELSVVLLDLTMPRLNGVAVARAIREARQDLPIVLMSGYSADEIAQIYADVKFNSVVQKPFTRNVLRAAIDEALGAAEGENQEPGTKNQEPSARN